MVYDRRYEDRTLNFEPSGALLNGSLVMRDRETDSWWSIMTSGAIGGDMKGSPLREMPVATKTTWREWRRQHPDSRVLSIAGETHVNENVYADYFESNEPFRDLRPDDNRLPPKAPIFVFEFDGEWIVIPHSKFGGGATFIPHPDSGAGPDVPQVFLYRPRGASIFQSTRAYRFPTRILVDVSIRSTGDLMTKLEGILSSEEQAKEIGVARIAGMDTYWYSWALQNPGTRILP